MRFRICTGLILAVIVQAVHAAEPTTQTAGGWIKSPASPVMGGKYGTCFDIAVLKESPGYRMFFSWRPDQCTGLGGSEDGVKLPGPPQVVLPPDKTTGWEDDVNRPIVLQRGGLYHMWYTGQGGGHS